MVFRCRLGVAFAAGAVAVVFARVPRAIADDAGVEDGAAPSTSAAAEAALHPPELQQFVQAQYPVDALQARVAGVVMLRLSIDVEGRVSAAEVVQPLGHGLDEAARDAALGFRFVPARRGETAIEARISYGYEFWLPPMAAAETEAAAPVALPAAAVRVEAAPAPVAAATALEVKVVGASRLDRGRRSAEAVTVIETEQAKRQSADMAEVLARTQGVGVRRAGGLGSSMRFSLNGLTDDQVRFFLDGVPLDLVGYPFGLANVPVNLIDRVEIYSGVVPVRFGADALGGAVNLVSEQDLHGTHAAGSYEVGSFDTHRLTLGGRHLDEASGFLTRVNGFLDYSRNDYPIDVEVPDELGRLSPARVYRFHDDYRATGGNVELGFVDRSWAKRLLLRAFLTDYDKEYQHNLVMTVPYGAATYSETSAGASLRYEQPLARGISLDVLGGYAYTRGHYLDVADCVYDWFGRCVRERRVAGETDTRPHDQLYWDHSAYARMNLSWRADPLNSFRLTVAPTYLTRTGDERRQSDPSARDPLAAQRDLASLVSGLEYQTDLFGGRLENILFVKQYLQVLNSEEPRPGDVFRRRDRNVTRGGIGNGIRYRFEEWLYAKLSYEWATRLPRADEFFGDNVFVMANLELQPETSHNLNLGLTLGARETDVGALRGTLNGFLRETKDLIVLLGSDRRQSYQNVFGARSLGIEGSAGWTSKGEYLALDGNFTYQSFRNTSSRGTFGDFEGDNIPNRPKLFANASAHMQFHDVASERDELSLTWSTRYVEDFFRGWESLGLRAFKQVVPSQLVHTAGLGYVVRGEVATVSTTVEVQNVSNEPAFDFFGVQRPGRAFYAKVTAEF